LRDTADQMYRLQIHLLGGTPVCGFKTKEPKNQRTKKPYKQTGRLKRGGLFDIILGID